MAPTVTRTLNPLPFEHLEPKRFEDLARQLAYDFKVWRQLEATGRSGSDYGFDARGFEIIPIRDVDHELQSELPLETSSDRMWLIQCKRERSIGPNKMKQHLASIPQESIDDLHGVLFVAACDFSKTTRDVLRSWCIENKIAEWQIWGKGEIEDLLFQPKNDGLLFAYFGISLRMKQQKMATNLRRTTSIKRKIKRIIEDCDHDIVIVRDVSDDRYPDCVGGSLLMSDCLWRVVHLRGLGIGGVRFLLHQFRAYHDRATGEWDIASGIDFSEPTDYNNPWRYEDKTQAERDLEVESHRFWISIPEKFRTEINLVAEIPYEAILEIDDVGDAASDLPTIYVDFSDGRIPTRKIQNVTMGDPDPYLPPTYVDKDQHRRIFPEILRNIAWETSWAERNNFVLARNVKEIKLEPPKWLQEVEEAFARSEGKTGG